MKKRIRVICFLLALLLAACLFLLALPPIISDEDWARTQSAYNLGMLYKAMEAYHQIYGHLPPPVLSGRNGEPLLSWRVALLPFVEDFELYPQFHLDEPWDSPHNHAFIEKIPQVYADMLGFESGITHYQIAIGRGTPFEQDGLTWNDFPDGRGNTILIVDAAGGVPWTKPADLHYDPNVSVGVLGSFHQKSIHFAGYTVGRRQVFNAIFADGSIHSFRKGKDPESLGGFLTRNGGERLDWSDVD
jgi:hypothetical protein